MRFETRTRLDWRGLIGPKRWIGLSPIAGRILIWARGEDGRGDVGGFILDREDEAIRPAVKPRVIMGTRATVRDIRPMA